jgi:hypothetical protein
MNTASTVKISQQKVLMFYKSGTTRLSLEIKTDVRTLSRDFYLY